MKISFLAVLLSIGCSKFNEVGKMNRHSMGACIGSFNKCDIDTLPRRAIKSSMDTTITVDNKEYSARKKIQEAIEYRISGTNSLKAKIF